MADIQRINSDDLQQCMNQYRSARAIVAESYEAYERALAALQSDWTGRAFDRYYDKAMNLKAKINKSEQNIDDVLNELSAVIQLATETEGSIKGKIASQEVGSESPFNAG